MHHQKQICDKQKVYNTGCSQAVSVPSTNPAQWCLTWQIGRDAVYSPWYGRRHFKISSLVVSIENLIKDEKSSQ